MSFVNIRKTNEAMNTRLVNINVCFRPMQPGKGENKIGPTSPPSERIDPIHESWSFEGIKSNGESLASSLIFAIAGLDQPRHVPHEIPTMFAKKNDSILPSLSSNEIHTNNSRQILVNFTFVFLFYQRLHFSINKP